MIASPVGITKHFFTQLQVLKLEIRFDTEHVEIVCVLSGRDKWGDTVIRHYSYIVGSIAIIEGAVVTYRNNVTVPRAQRGWSLWVWVPLSIEPQLVVELFTIKDESLIFIDIPVGIKLEFVLLKLVLENIIKLFTVLNSSEVSKNWLEATAQNRRNINRVVGHGLAIHSYVNVLIQVELRCLVQDDLVITLFTSGLEVKYWSGGKFFGHWHKEISITIVRLHFDDQSIYAIQVRILVTLNFIVNVLRHVDSYSWLIQLVHLDQFMILNICFYLECTV